MVQNRSEMTYRILEINVSDQLKATSATSSLVMSRTTSTQAETKGGKSSVGT